MNPKGWREEWGEMLALYTLYRGKKNDSVDGDFLEPEREMEG